SLRHRKINYMRLLKLITAYCMFSHASLIPADTISAQQDIPTEAPITPETNEKSESTAVKPGNIEEISKDAIVKQNSTDVKAPETKEDIKEINDITKWQDHLKTLLVKGAFWDSNSNSPTNDWISSAETIAEEVLTKDVSQAEELKTSFAATINEKFLTVEKGTNIVPIATLINEFNKK